MTEPRSGDTSRTASSRARSRAVSNLTQEQIQHKRDIDRKAQRAFRQRTKDCIANLEQQFSQLQETCWQLRQDCDWKDQELDSMREQNKALLKCLEGVSELISATLGQANRNFDQNSSPDEQESQSNEDDGSSGLPPDEGDQEIQPAQPPQINHQEEAEDSRMEDTHTEEMPNPQPESTDVQAEDVSVNHQTPNTDAAATAATVHPISAHNEYEAHSAEVYHLPSTTHASLPSPPGNVQSTEHAAHVHGNPASQVGTVGSHVTPNEAHGDFLTPCSTMLHQKSYNTSGAVHTVLPVHLAPTCPLDLILLDFLTSRRELLSDGTYTEIVIGPEKPSVRSLVDNQQVDFVHPLSGIISRILSTFPSVKLTEKLAFFFLMCHTMRWQILPTRENYLVMPSWLRPTVTQITVPHAAWIDNIPWPGVRDILIENPAEYPFQLFSDYYSQHVTVNWGFDGLDAVSNLEGGGVLHSIFEKHIRNLKNWTVSQEFHERFPVMSSSINSRD